MTPCRRTGKVEESKGLGWVGFALTTRSMTPVSTIVAAYERCLDDAEVYGKIIECSTDKQFELETPTLANGHYSTRAVTVWDPLFKMCVTFPDA